MSQPYGATPGLAELNPIADGYLMLSAKGVREDFAQDLTAEEQSTMIATQAPTQSALSRNQDHESRLAHQAQLVCDRRP
jgi:diadenosine tetraphosphate (Ap4A) HIT family hydrolase